jgi:hypothetical protein
MGKSYVSLQLQNCEDLDFSTSKFTLETAGFILVYFCWRSETKLKWDATKFLTNTGRLIRDIHFKSHQDI